VKRNEAGGARVVARGVIRGPEAGDEAVLESSSQGEVLRLEDYQIAPTKLLSTSLLAPASISARACSVTISDYTPAAEV
jgi:hypothetical protein